MVENQFKFSATRQNPRPFRWYAWESPFTSSCEKWAEKLRRCERANSLHSLFPSSWKVRFSAYHTRPATVLYRLLPSGFASAIVHLSQLPPNESRCCQKWEVKKPREARNVCYNTHTCCDGSHAPFAVFAIIIVIEKVVCRRVGLACVCLRVYLVSLRYLQIYTYIFYTFYFSPLLLLRLYTAKDLGLGAEHNVPFGFLHWTE